MTATPNPQSLLLREPKLLVPNSKPLPSTKVKYNPNGPWTRPELLWLFNEGNFIYDYSGNGNHGEFVAGGIVTGNALDLGLWNENERAQTIDANVSTPTNETTLLQRINITSLDSSGCTLWENEAGTLYTYWDEYGSPDLWAYQNEELSGSPRLDGTGMNNVLFKYEGLSTSRRHIVMWLNGKVVHTAQLWTATALNSTDQWHVSSPVNEWGMAGYMEMMAFWNTPQSEEACEELTRDPYQLFELA